MNQRQSVCLIRTQGDSADHHFAQTAQGLGLGDNKTCLQGSSPTWHKATSKTASHSVMQTKRNRPTRDRPENLPVRNAAAMARIMNSATSKQATPRGPRLCGDKPLTAALAEATADSGQPSQPSVLLFQKIKKQIASSAVEQRGIVADGRWRCVFYK
jgi:hypothetical protein